MNHPETIKQSSSCWKIYSSHPSFYPHLSISSLIKSSQISLSPCFESLFPIRNPSFLSLLLNLWRLSSHATSSSGQAIILIYNNCLSCW
ncbi:unnamed protein product [Prunus brigantina]